jgi:hypothetical protein
MLVDIEVTSLSPSTSFDPTGDVKHFFTAPEDKIGRSGTPKLHRRCKSCKKYVSDIYQ